MVHRIDPRFPVVWRSPSSVQVGVDPARAVLEPVGQGTERMLAALVSGATRPGLALLSGGDDPDELLAVLAPVLESAVPAAEVSVAVLGAGRTAVLVARLLHEHGVHLSGAADETPDAAVLVSHYAVPPAARGTWLRRDVPHLSVVFSDTGAMVGPLVDPGRGPCLTCVELHHRDRDPAWPALASQLVDRTSGVELGAVTAEAAAVAVRMLLPRLLRPSDDPPVEATAVAVTAVAVRIDGMTGERTEHVVARHPHCSCGDGGPPAGFSADRPGTGWASELRSVRDAGSRPTTVPGASARG
jgi:bacteriocin biosynthesis cyclodehydratase domain-containing protein